MCNAVVECASRDSIIKFTTDMTIFRQLAIKSCNMHHVAHCIKGVTHVLFNTRLMYTHYWELEHMCK